MADTKFPLTKAQLTGDFCETLTYGMYIVTCGFVARTLLLTGPEERWRRPSEIRWFMVGFAVSLFAISTFDVIIGLEHNILAFVEYKGPGGAGEELTDISEWINIARSVAQVIQMIIGDFVLIYRCYIVYARRWPVIVPSGILYLGGIAMALRLIHVEASLDHKAITLNSNEIHPWWDAFFAITMVQNTLTTSLLVWRIWRVERQNEKFRATRHGSASVANTQPRLRKVIRVIAESGSAYTLMVFMTFVVSVCGSNALYPLSDATLQATGIAFNVIIVRSSARRDEQFTVFDTDERAVAEQGFNLRSLNFASGQSTTKTNHNVPDGVHFTVKTEVSGDGGSQVEMYNITDKKPASAFPE